MGNLQEQVKGIQKYLKKNPTIKLITNKLVSILLGAVTLPVFYYNGYNYTTGEKIDQTNISEILKCISGIMSLYAIFCVILIFIRERGVLVLELAGRIDILLPNSIMHDEVMLAGIIWGRSRAPFILGFLSDIKKTLKKAIKNVFGKKKEKKRK